MDPEAALDMCRKRAKDILSEPDEVFLADAHELAEHFQALDEWLTKGGSKPMDWSKGCIW